MCAGEGLAIVVLLFQNSFCFFVFVCFCVVVARGHRENVRGLSFYVRDGGEVEGGGA